MLQQSVSLTKNDLIIRGFFFVSSKAAKTRDFGALFGGKEQEAQQHKTNLGHLLLMFVCHTKCSSILAALTLAVIDIAHCSAQLCHILISNRCETNQCHLCPGLPTRSLATKNRQISHFHINHHCQQLNKSKNGHFSLASLNSPAN